MKKESAFQHGLIKELRNRYPGSIVLKNDPNYIQGFPDLTVFYGNKWAALECKRSADESHQPNQDYYVDYLGKQGYSSFVYPENREEVLNELDGYFGSGS